MAKKLFWIGILVMALVFGMTVVGCDNDPTDDSAENSSGDNPGGNDPGGSNPGGGNNPGITRPSAPTGVSATVLSSSSIRVSWNSVSGATGYRVYYANANNSNPVLHHTVTGTSHDFTSLMSNSTYYYKVSAENSAGEGAASTIVSTTTSSSSGSNLTWTVMFDRNGGSGTNPSTQTVNRGSSITLPSGSGLSRSGFTFGGWNTNSSGTGTNYNAGSSYTPTSSLILYARWNSTVTTVPSAPTGLVAEQVGANGVMLSWNNVSSATRYEIQYSTNGTSWSLDDYSTLNLFVSTGWWGGVRAYFRVRAQNSIGWGLWSSTVSVYIW